AAEPWAPRATVGPRRKGEPFPPVSSPRGVHVTRRGQAGGAGRHRIRLFDDPALRVPCEPVVTFDRSVRDLVKSLHQVMRAGPGRAGLAAPQLGVPLRVIAFDVDG